MILPFIPLEKNFPTTTMCPVGETPLSKIQKFMALFPSTFSELIADLYPSFLYLFLCRRPTPFELFFSLIDCSTPYSYFFGAFTLVFSPFQPSSLLKITPDIVTI